MSQSPFTRSQKKKENGDYHPDLIRLTERSRKRRLSSSHEVLRAKRRGGVGGWARIFSTKKTGKGMMA
jgi:hypothetical protein